MVRKKILFIGGSLNQTTIAHTIAKHLENDYDCYFTPYYCDGLLDLLRKAGWLNWTTMGGRFRLQTDTYFRENNLRVDYGGKKHDYDLFVTLSDLIVQKNLRGKKVILIQEGMTDPEDFVYHLVKWFKLPRYLASSSTNGLSDVYQAFCVASEGYRDLFIRKGVKPEKIYVTGIPNFDHAAQYLDNDFPFKHYVLVATSDARETFKFDNRKKFIRRALEIANGRPIIFKLHPNEKVERATTEINALAPDALVFADGDTNHMVANCDVLITQYSSVVYIGLALGKEVYSYFDLEMLKQLVPIQNGGSSGKNIAQVCHNILKTKQAEQLRGEVSYANVVS
jgi:hypothetical protein